MIRYQPLMQDWRSDFNEFENDAGWSNHHYAANRLSSVMHADETCHGWRSITERGTHEALLAADGWYAEMWLKQQLIKP